MPLLAVAVAVISSVIASFPAPADGRNRNCLRGGATQVAASETVRVVRVSQRRDKFETKRDRLLGCRTSNGRRFLLRVEVDQPDDFFQSSSFQIIEDRFIGAIFDETGAISEYRSAAVWDSRSRRRLRTSSGCASNPGVHEVAFLPLGGLAYSCDALYLANAGGQRQLEPATSIAHDLAAAVTTFTYRLYWSVDGPGGRQERSILVRYR